MTDGTRNILAEIRGQGAIPTTPTPEDEHSEIGEGPHFETNTGTPPDHGTPPNPDTEEVGHHRYEDYWRRSPDIPTDEQDCSENNDEDPSEQDPDQGEDQGDPGDEPTPNTKKKRKRPKKAKKGKTSRASVMIASLNMRGHGAFHPDNASSKWQQINQIMRVKKIGILAIQEAHLTEELADQINDVFQRRLHVLWSQGDNSRAKGIAFVINSELISTHKHIKLDEIIPGRAAMLTINWHNDLKVKILNVYAPANGATANGAFWKELKNEMERINLPKPDVMMGDFNTVEDSIDRLPNRPDPASAVDPLQDLRNKLNLVDGWRSTNPSEKNFTWTDGRTLSRIDRIYTTNRIMRTSVGWDIERIAGIETDHALISVRLTNPQMPHIGKGRWTLPELILKNKKFINATIDEGVQLTRRINNVQNRSEHDNAQKEFEAFKTKIMTNARVAAKVEVPKLRKTIENLKKDHKAALNREDKSEKETITEAGILQKRITGLENLNHAAIRMATTVRDRIEGETISKYWSNINAERKPREVMYALEIPGTTPPKYETDTTKMAEIARNHHHTLLKDEIPDEEPTRQADINETLQEVRDEQKLPEEDKAKLGSQIEYSEVAMALRDSENYKAAGINGIPYELWKALHDRHTQAKKQNAEAETFDIVGVLTKVYNDIETHGINPGSQFAAGWMCPLYKKKDKRDIANYRPITLLNTDYKIFTKAIATRLGKLASKMIHVTQAGFIPGRSIFDQVKLTSLMLKYTEATEEDGMIIALDQEKAYDKIRHDYLWMTMRKYNLPESMIKTVKSLYENAQTQVMLNGVLSKTFEVSRGVRQGDPLSCLLFDIAIEPLSNAMRNSEKLQGFKIPGVEEKLIATLFADDTTVYLSKSDQFADLEDLLKKWCKASGARFNVAKTEIIPCGTEEHRNQMLLTRTHNPDFAPLPDNIRIAQDREATRTLGAWVGNKVDNIQVWSNTLDKMNASLERWGRGHPSLNGKKHIIQMIVGGMTQYLTTVQGMPKAIELTVIKAIKKFAWDDKRSPVNIETMSLPIGKGGLGYLDLKARNEAIEIMWIKKYLTLEKDRPMWAFVADVLIQRGIPSTKGHVDERVATNMFLQKWKPALGGKSKLPKDLQTMIKAAKKWNVNAEAIRISDKAKMALPAWYHIGSEDHPTGLHRRLATECLKTTHNIKTISDAQTTTKRLRDNSPGHTHRPRKNCACKYCKDDKRNGCENPNACCNIANGILDRLKPKWDPKNAPPQDNLTLTKSRLEKNANASSNDEFTTFNPSIQQGDDLSHIIRVFTEPGKTSADPAYRRNRDIPMDPEVVAYTDGSCISGGSENARTGSGIWFGENHPENKSLRVPGEAQSNQVGEVVAVLHTVRTAPVFAPLKILSDSKYVIDGLTVFLKEWEEHGFIGIANREFFMALAALLRERGAPTMFKWIKGHAGIEGNEGADQLAGDGAWKEETDEIDLNIKDKFNLSGAQLSKMTQALAYEGIKELQKPPKSRSGTTARLDITRYAVEDNFKSKPLDHAIWTAIQHKDFSRSVRIFFWRALHNSHKIGEFWDRIPNYEVRGKCQECSTAEGQHITENMDHILLECNNPTAKTIWKLAETLWKKKMPTWPELRNTGSIIACSLASFKSPKGKILAGANRLYRIIISESAHLIWKMRNKRLFDPPKFEDEQPTEPEIHNKWLKAINMRLKLDMAMTKPKYETKALKRHIVLQTWRGTLDNEKNLPPDWTQKTGVIVGIEQRERVHMDE